MDHNEIKALGSSLRPIDQRLLKSLKDTSLKRIWYQGKESYFDIFFELQDDKIVWFQFTLRGKTLSWESKNRRLQTGSTNELKPDVVTYYPASKLIQNDGKTDFDFIELVRAILQTRAGEDIFDQALGLMEEATRG